MSDVVVLACDWLGNDPAVVLVSPDDEVDTVVEHALRDELLWAVLDARREQFSVNQDKYRFEAYRF